MKKDDYFELIIKAFGIYLLILAILAIPNVLSSMVMVIFWPRDIMHESEVNGLMGKLGQTMVLRSFEQIFRFTILFVISLNFLRSGSLVKKLVGAKTKTTEPNNNQDDVISVEQ
jgi:hypothetical protein